MFPPGSSLLRPRKSKAAWSLAAAANAIARGPFDIVYCGHLYSAPVAAAVSRLAGATLWLQLHGIEAWRPPGWMVRSALSAPRASRRLVGTLGNSF